jgi:hypothetical protein
MGDGKHLTLPAGLVIGIGPLVSIASVVGGPIPASVFAVAFGSGLLLSPRSEIPATGETRPA